MFQFDIEKFVPKFILADKNGYAIAKALGAALQMMNDIINDGVDCVTDYEKMPEWRLDEMAWEYNIPYDYTADIEIKRAWVQNVLSLSHLYGTPEGVKRYMEGYFESASIEEAWEYGGDPYHFRMIFPDSWTPEKVAWATKAIAAVKNVRSILDTYTFDAKWLHNLFVGCALYTYESATYQVPAVEIESDWYIDELGNMLLDENSILLTVEG